MSWIRVNKNLPCPICHRPDWCLIASDGDAAICQRVESNKRIGDAGYLHKLTDSISQTFSYIIHGKVNQKDFSKLADKYHNNMFGRWDGLSKSLGVSVKSLKRLGVGYDGDAYTFPMQDGECIIGIRRRFSDGLKLCLTGSKNGLFIPSGLHSNTLLVGEGNTDTAKALDLGFDAIGRPNCNSCIAMTCRFIKHHPYKQVVIIPDNDIKENGSNPGVDGGQRLADCLRLYCSDVRLVIPPAGCDLRAWDVSRDEMLGLIESSEKINLEVTL